MTFCRIIYVQKVMKLLAFIFEQPSYFVSKRKFNIEPFANLGKEECPGVQGESAENDCL